MKTNELRNKFLAYFEQHGHAIVQSSSLVPANDPTLLFTNAGMVQFKDVFLGNEKRPYTRATSSQCCVRAGGKHNDLENVGYTARHHTFFEMLGNFSFGDYFKREAIEYAWNFLTKELSLSPEKLWVTVFKDDQEAEDIWLNEIGVDSERFSRCGEKDNFWSMGDTGPCGPCSEIFYDHGSGIPGGPPGSPEEDGDRYVEIWNLVFMQYNRAKDGTMTPLPKPSVDTGMGLERIAAVMQGVHSNYYIDLFDNLISAAAKLTGVKNEGRTSLRVIADHIRSVAFLIADGVTPSNEGRGYVLRRIIRRAIRHGNKLGQHKPFFSKLVPALVNEMGDAYPKLREKQSLIEKAILREEEQFAKTLDQGLKLLEQALANIQGDMIPGDVVFKLYDTYGFPTDLTADIARERQLRVDYAGFEKEMAKQKQLSQSASQFSVDYTKQLQIRGETEFTGYEKTTDSGAVTNLFVVDDGEVDILQEGQQGIVVLDRTPFYAESGGQVGDTGLLQSETGQFRVLDTKKQGLVYLHIGEVQKGEMRVGDQVDAEVDSTRQAIMLNHTATHLLHAALRRVVGKHVVQKGSLVEADRLRFDFAHHAPLTREEIIGVERLVNQQIRANLTGHVDVMTPEQAMKKGALALFDEKYGEHVRVLSIGEFSMELCGGTHVEHTGEIGYFKILSETGIAAGIRRLEALTGEQAVEWVEQQESQLLQAADLIKTKPANLLEKLQQVQKQQRELEKELEKLKSQMAAKQSGDLNAQAVEVDGVKVLATTVNDVDAKTLRQMVDQLKQQLKPSLVILASVSDDKVSMVAGVSKEYTEKLKAGEALNFVATQIGGKGGGRADMAQGGGGNPNELPTALKAVAGWVKTQLS